MIFILKYRVSNQGRGNSRQVWIKAGVASRPFYSIKKKKIAHSLTAPPMYSLCLRERGVEHFLRDSVRASALLAPTPPQRGPQLRRHPPRRRPPRRRPPRRRAVRGRGFGTAARRRGAGAARTRLALRYPRRQLSHNVPVEVHHIEVGAPATQLLYKQKHNNRENKATLGILKHF
jgi:hypothetical protein